MTIHRGPFRLAQGGLIDRLTPLDFEFNGKYFRGFSGDSLASALLANGVRTVARSFKFHRPRGVFSCGVEEPNALLQLEEGVYSIPSARSPVIELRAGLRARSQVGWPHLDFDVGRSLDILAPLWSAGFYNKTFIWPNWHTYEPTIRRLAGLGRVPSGRDPDRYEVGNLHCDLLVVGGGVAGLQAALQAAQQAERVVVVEQDHQFGGESAWNGASIGELSSNRWLSQALQRLKQYPDVRLLSRTTATGCYDGNVVALLERVVPARADAPRERYWIVRTQRLVLATGSIEQPLIFDNNDRPGIVLASSARQYLCRYGISIGARVLIATNNDSAYPLAQGLTEAGVSVVGVADTRPSQPAAIRGVMRSLNVEVFPSSIPIETAGFSALRSVTLGRLSADGTRVHVKRELRCDALAVSGGFSPTLHLFAQSGGKLAYDDRSGALWPLAPLPAVQIVGSAATKIHSGPRISPVGNTKRQWVDLLHDVTVADLQLALRENFTALEHVKRYTTVGMAADQGKTSAAATLSVLGALRGISPRELGHTTLRPPFTPVTLGAIAGREIGERFAPHRRLPMHEWHVANGALFHNFGEWRRPVAYLRDGESREQAMRREALGVRHAAGLLDSSSLGKIEIHGPDALEFLDRFYINDLTTLKPHRARYGIMLRETGTIFDDGTVVMLAPDRLLITTTSGNAGRVEQWLEEWHQCEWPKLRIAIVPVTDQWATISLAGPLARLILAFLDTDIDLSVQAFPHLGMREGRLMGLPARIYRVSFTGELTFEINVPARAGRRLWEALMHAGRSAGLTPLGMDALLQLRLEKGFLHVGSDTDGTTVPDDVGWGKAAANKKRNYIGKRSLTLPENQRADRWHLIGLAPDSSRRFTIGSHLRLPRSRQATDGWITSAGIATLTNEPVALAMLRGGRGKIGASVDLYDAGSVVGKARVMDPIFYDPSGESAADGCDRGLMANGRDFLRHGF